MTTFLEDASSPEDSEPREGLEIVTQMTTWRIATGTRNVVINGFTYRAEPGSRGESGVSASGDSRELIISLPMSHALCRRYMAGSVPPRRIVVNVWQKQLRSGEVEQVWSGEVTSMAPSSTSDGRHLGNFRVPSRMGEALLRRMPQVTTGKKCSHRLYDAGCRVVEADFTIATTVATVAGRVVTVASMSGKLDDWAEFGRLKHVASGEWMPIQSQVGNVVTMQLPIFELQAGDAIQVIAGCNHLIETGCRDKFANVDNYGGFPYLPVLNPFKFPNWGLITQP